VGGTDAQDFLFSGQNAFEKYLAIQIRANSRLIRVIRGCFCFFICSSRRGLISFRRDNVRIMNPLLGLELISTLEDGKYQIEFATLLVELEDDFIQPARRVGAFGLQEVDLLQKLLQTDG
jgi:hypothetical protein